MNIFPLGATSAASSQGTIDSVSYSLFEPNLKCKSVVTYSVLHTRFEQQSILSRKKAEPYLVVTYEYENIYDREYRQIEHFIDSIVEGSLNSFYVADFSRGQTPTSVTDSSGDWVVAINNTRLYSTSTNEKAFKALVWNGLNWKEGSITSITTNTSVTMDVDTDDFGALTLANANSRGYIYPLYQVYTLQNPLANFKPTVFIDDNINTSDVGGFMRKGTIAFTTKYKV